MFEQYSVSEIKYNIDTAIQRAMYEDKDKVHWDAFLELQARLYEEFGIVD